MPDVTYWRDILHADVLRAHRAWLFRGRIGEGRIVLHGQSLGEAHTHGLSLDDAVFDTCDLTGARLTYAGLHHVEITNCTFTDGSLHTSQLVHATLRGNRFDRADLRGCWFTDSIIEDCTFDGADLDMSNFVRARITNSTLMKTRLADTQIDHAHFERCDFRGACLNDSALSAHFVDCDLRGANLDGLRLKDTRFTRCRLAGITGTPRIEGSYELIDPDFATEDSLPEGSPRSADELRRHWERR